MSQFWIGYLSALATYFAIGFGIGLYIVITNLARFHGGGFQWKRMANHIGMLTLFWPAAIVS